MILFHYFYVCVYLKVRDQFLDLLKSKFGQEIVCELINAVSPLGLFL